MISMKKFIMFLIEKRILSFKLISSLRYALKFKKWPNFNSPRDLNEKVMWLSFYSDTSLWSKLADKIEVRNYVESKGLKELLPRLLGAWDHANEIDFDKLPNSRQGGKNTDENRQVQAYEILAGRHRGCNRSE